MNTEEPAQSPPASPSPAPEITNRSHSELPAPAVTGNLDSEFFLDLVGAKTQIPQPGDTHSGNSSADRSTDLDLQSVR